MVGELQYGRLKTPDAHADVFKQLTDNLKMSQVTEVDFSSCGIGPVALGHLSEWVREATAALNSLTLHSNGIFGQLDFGYSNPTREPDKFVDQCEAFFSSLKTSNINTLSLKLTGMGPVALQKLATSLPAALTKIDVRNNTLDADSLETLKVAASQGCEIMCD